MSYNQHFNKEFKDLSVELLSNTKVSCFGILTDIFMSAIRAVPAGVLLYRHISTNNPINIIATISVGLFLMFHSFYARYKSRLAHAALDIRLKQGIIALQTNVSEDMSSEETFDFIKEYFKTRALKNAVTFLNVGGRMGRWFAFLGFLITLNELIKTNSDLNLDFYDLLCIQQLWCNPSLENDASFFQKDMIDNFAYYRTKINLERNSPYFGLVHLFFKTKSDYPKDYLISYLSNMKKIGTGFENKYCQDCNQKQEVPITPLFVSIKDKDQNIR